MAAIWIGSNSVCVEPRQHAPSQVDFELHRYPIRANESLQAWDAADKLILRQLEDHSETIGDVLVVNDNWGALSTALAHRGPSTLSDSYLAHAAARANLRRNHIDVAAVRPLTSFDPLPDRVDILVMKVPKSLALLEDQLHRIAPHLHDKSTVLAAAMTQHIHRSTLDLFAKIVGPTRTSLAEKKARLIFCETDPNLQLPPNPWPKTYTVIPGDQVVTNHAGVFAAESLDGGARLLLEHLPRRDGPHRIVDRGCGNGVRGVRAAIRSPEAEITFVDESYRAVASAEATFRANLGAKRMAHFVVGNGLFDLEYGAPAMAGFDLVLNNPPFNENHAISDSTAWQMFIESRDVLRPGGELWVVGNRHLGYRDKLKRLFCKCDIVASNGKFVVLRATKTLRNEHDLLCRRPSERWSRARV
jgi:16S rRNA (guanine1207-N2)-methyltransferase